MDNNDIVGAWKLVSYELRLRDGIVLRPMGEGVRGILMYRAALFQTGPGRSRSALLNSPATS